MIKMDQYVTIRTSHSVYGKSVRAISRDTGHHRRTIRKALSGTEPGYHRVNPVRFPVLEKYLEVIDQWLESDRDAPPKQRHTACRIYDRLVEEQGFQGGRSTVRNYVGMRKKELNLTRKESMIPLCPEAGREAEVDWGEAEAVINGVQIRIYLFCMRSRYSGKIFLRSYPTATQEMFFDAHMEGFQYFGGVFPVQVYDNLRTAVKKILRGRDRVEQEGFQSFRGYYVFEARFCNPGEGHEKGGVEGLVGYSRRNFLVPVPTFGSFEEINKYLLSKCDQHNQTHTLIREERSIKVEDLFSVEKSQLRKLPENSYSNVRLSNGKVSHYQTVCVERNHYSVPSQYVGLTLQVTIKCWTIQIHYQQTLVASHHRLFGQNHWSLEPCHYLDVLKRKPGAVDQARPLLKWKENWPEYEEMLQHLRKNLGFSEGTRQFIGILQLTQRYKEEDVQVAVRMALSSNTFGLDAVKLILDDRWTIQLSFPSLEPWQLPGGTGQVSVKPPDLSRFNQLMGGKHE